MDPNAQWPPPPRPLPPPVPVRPRTARRWLPAAILSSAIVLAAGLIGGALILNGKDAADGGPTTCQSWTQTRLTLRAIPALPKDWTWKTPNITTSIKNQNAAVAKALEVFEPQIAAEPADVAQAANDYVAARRAQMAALSDRSYTPEVGAAVDTALGRLNQLCGIPAGGQPI